MNRILTPLFILVIVVAAAVGGFYVGHKTFQCTEIKLYNDYKFTCDGRKIQGPTYKNEYVKQAWEFHSSIN